MWRAITSGIADNDIFFTMEGGVSGTGSGAHRGGAYDVKLKHLLQFIYFPCFIPGFTFLYLTACRNLQKQRKILAEVLEARTAKSEKVD